MGLQKEERNRRSEVVMAENFAKLMTDTKIDPRSPKNKDKQQKIYILLHHIQAQKNQRQKICMTLVAYGVIRSTFSHSPLGIHPTTRNKIPKL